MNRRNPYKSFDYYTAEDAPYFLGREAEIDSVVGDILSTKLLVLFARSGSGKTSLLNAGIGPALASVARVPDDPGILMVMVRLSGDELPERAAFTALVTAFRRQMPDREEVIAATDTLHEALRKLCSFESDSEPPEQPPGVVLVFDQFEEMFISLYENDPGIRQKFAESLASIIYDDNLRAYVVLSLRSDQFHHLNEFRELIPTIFQNNTNLELRPFDAATALRVILGPQHRPQIEFRWRPELPERIVADLEKLNPDADGILPIQLQVVCSKLWGSLKFDEFEITPQHYERFLANWPRAQNPADAILHTAIVTPLGGMFQRYHALLLDVLDQLTTEQETKAVCSLQELRRRIPDVSLTRVLDDLEAASLLRKERREADVWYELTHDYLARQIKPWRTRKREVLHRRRLTKLISAFVVAVILCVLCVRLWTDWHHYHGRLGSDARFDELTIVRDPMFNRFRPGWWERTISTGLSRASFKDREVDNVEIDLPDGLNNWSRIASHLRRPADFALRLTTLEGLKGCPKGAATSDLEDTNPQFFDAVNHPDLAMYATVDPRIADLARCAVNGKSREQFQAAVSALANYAPILDPPFATDIASSIEQNFAVIGGTLTEKTRAWSGMIAFAPYFADKTAILRLMNVVPDEFMGAIGEFVFVGLKVSTADALLREAVEALLATEATPMAKQESATTLGYMLGRDDLSSTQAGVAAVIQSLLSQPPPILRDTLIEDFAKAAFADNVSESQAQEVPRIFREALANETAVSPKSRAHLVRAIARLGAKYDLAAKGEVLSELAAGMNTDVEELKVATIGAIAALERKGGKSLAITRVRERFNHSDLDNVRLPALDALLTLRLEMNRTEIGKAVRAAALSMDKRRAGRLSDGSMSYLGELIDGSQARDILVAYSDYAGEFIDNLDEFLDDGEADGTVRSSAQQLKMGEALLKSLKPRALGDLQRYAVAGDPSLSLLRYPTLRASLSARQRSDLIENFRAHALKDKGAADRRMLLAELKLVLGVVNADQALQLAEDAATDAETSRGKLTPEALSVLGGALKAGATPESVRPLVERTWEAARSGSGSFPRESVHRLTPVLNAIDKSLAIRIVDDAASAKGLATKTAEAGVLLQIAARADTRTLARALRASRTGLAVVHFDRKAMAEVARVSGGVSEESLVHSILADDSEERLFAIYALAARAELSPMTVAALRMWRDDPQERPWVRAAALEALAEHERVKRIRALPERKAQRFDYYLPNDSV